MSNDTAAKQWNRNVDNLLHQIKRSVATGFTEVAAELTTTRYQRGAVDQTDTDTQGDFLGNWHLVEDPSQAPGFVEGRYRDPSGDAALARAEKNAERLGNLKKKPLKFYFVNVAPYAHKLEYGGYAKNTPSSLTTPDGYSTQAPKGMIRQYSTEDRNRVLSWVQEAVKRTIKNTRAR